MRKRIAIIGGGISGLTCLHEIKKSNVHVDLYEASSRVGGRISTYVDSQYQMTVEMGAGYFHEYYFGLKKIII